MLAAQLRRDLGLAVAVPLLLLARPGFHRPAVAVYASERHPIRGRVRRGRTIGPSAGIARIDAC